MGATTRQFKALAKKNFINQKRKYCCSICEIVCPALLMFMLVMIRGLFDSFTPDADDSESVLQEMVEFSIAVHPVFWWDGNNWVEEIRTPGQAAENMISQKIDPALKDFM